MGRCPYLLGDLLEQVGGVAREGEPDGVLRPVTVCPGGEVLGATGTVGTDQDLLARTGRVGPGQLGQGVTGHADVVGGGVGAGVARGCVIAEGQYRPGPRPVPQRPRGPC